MSDPWDTRLEALGAFIRTRRKLAHLSLRQLADMTSVSNPYLSQVERGLHQPSVRVLKLLSDALNVSAETLLAEAGLLDAAGAASAGGPGRGSPVPDVEAAIRADQRLSEEHKSALIAVYQSMLRPG
jgi:transcriptional regulator with XRE-family HTH domain